MKLRWLYLRDIARAVACPMCSAARGDACRRMNGEPRHAMHAERITEGLAVLGIPVSLGSPAADAWLNRVREERRR